MEEALAVVRKDLSGQRISPGTSQAEEEEMAPDDTIRTFDTGATRDSELGKFDYEGFLSPCVLERYAEYMDKHRVQSDGKLRDSDNWQKGIPVTAYTKSLWRHFFDVWKIHRGYQVFDPKGGHAIDQEEALCGLIFNAMGLLHTLTDDREFLPEETSS